MRWLPILQTPVLFAAAVAAMSAGSARAQLADLRVVDLRLTSSALNPGGSVQATVAVRNAGPVGARASRLRFQVSKPRFAGQVMTEVDVPVIQAFATWTSSVTLPVPIDLIFAGACEVTAIADATNVVPELFEGNNTRSVAAFGIVKSDLEVSGMAGAARWMPGSRYEFTVTIRNRGGLPTGSVELGLYLSSDRVIRVSDTVLVRSTVASLQRNESITRRVSGTIPPARAVGPCSIGFIIDTRDVEDESFEDNNTTAIHGVCAIDGSHVSFGSGCRTRNGTLTLRGAGAPTQGRSASYGLTRGVPLQPAVLVLGASRTLWQGGRLPLDLGPIGAPGCQLRVGPLATLSARTNPLGSVSFSVPLPLGLAGDTFYTQAVMTGVQNVLTLATSNGVATRIGG